MAPCTSATTPPARSTAWLHPDNPAAPLLASRAPWTADDDVVRGRGDHGGAGTYQHGSPGRLRGPVTDLSGEVDAPCVDLPAQRDRVRGGGTTKSAWTPVLVGSGATMISSTANNVVISVCPLTQMDPP